MFTDKIFNLIRYYYNTYYYNKFSDYKHSLASSNYSLLYIPIPKNACSTTKMWLLSLEGYDIIHRHGLSGKPLYCSEYGNIHKCANRELNFFRNNKVKPKNIKKFYKFTIIRNPWIRVVSAFKDKFCGKYEGFKKYSHINFRTFVNNIMVNQDNEHWRPQINFIKDAKLDKIVRFESIVEDMSAITKHKNIPPFPEKGRNYLEDIDIPGYNCVSDIKASQLFHFKKKYRGLPNYKKFYTPDLIQKVYNFYKEDIIKFGYTFENNKNTETREK